MEYNFPNSWFHCAVLRRKPDVHTHAHTHKKPNKKHVNKPNNNNKPDPKKLKFAFVCYIHLKDWFEFCTQLVGRMLQTGTKHSIFFFCGTFRCTSFQLAKGKLKQPFPWI